MNKSLVVAVSITVLSGNLALAQTPAPHGNTVNKPTNVNPSTGVGTGVMSPPPSAGNTEAGPPIVPAPSANTGQVPVPGASSFTEGQARSRLADNGFQEIGNLRKNDQGVWQGTAMKNGKQVNVGLDYQGNIVTR